MTETQNFFYSINTLSEEKLFNLGSRSLFIKLNLLTLFKIIVPLGILFLVPFSSSLCGTTSLQRTFCLMATWAFAIVLAILLFILISKYQAFILNRTELKPIVVEKIPLYLRYHIMAIYLFIAFYLADRLLVRVDYVVYGFCLVFVPTHLLRFLRMRKLAEEIIESCTNKDTIV